MAMLKCKMCGGNLNINEDVSTAECEYCGSVQTVPKVDDEKKLTLFARLQARDLGKMGAIQDIVRGVQKLLPKQEQTVKETVAVQQATAGVM